MSTRAIVSSFAGLATGQFLASIVAFGSVVLLAGHFGASGLGGLFLVYALLEYATIFAACGTEPHAVRRVAANRAELERMVTSIMFVRIVLGVVAYGALLLVTVLVPSFRDLTPLAAVLGLCLVPLALRTAWAPQALHQAPVVGVAQFATQSIYLGVVLLVIHADLSLLAVAAGRVVADLMVSFGLLAWLRAQSGPFLPVMRFAELGHLLRESWPLGATQMCRTVAFTSDLVLTGLFVDRVALGHYAAASRLFLALAAIGAGYFVVLLPRIAAAASQQKGDRELSDESGLGRGDAVGNELRASLRLVVPCTVAVALVGGLSAPVTLNLLFGPGFSAAALPLAVLLLALIPYMIGRHYRQVLVATDLQDQDLRISAFGAAAHVVSKLVLVPLLGIFGSALGTLVGESVQMFGQRRAALAELRGRAVVAS